MFKRSTTKIQNNKAICWIDEVESRDAYVRLDDLLERCEGKDAQFVTTLVREDRSTVTYVNSFEFSDTSVRVTRGGRGDFDTVFFKMKHGAFSDRWLQEPKEPIKMVWKREVDVFSLPIDDIASMYHILWEDKIYEVSKYELEPSR